MSISPDKPIEPRVAGTVAHSWSWLTNRSVIIATVILAVIIVVAPHARTITNEASTEVYGIDILGLTTAAKDLPEQQYAAY